MEKSEKKKKIAKETIVTMIMKVVANVMTKLWNHSRNRRNP